MPTKKRKQDIPSVRLQERIDRPWCYYCNKDFDDLRVLIDHQKSKHYRCLVHGCNRHLNTAGGLRVHMSQVHKEDVRYVPNALDERSDIHVEIFGMEGIPQPLIDARNHAITTEFFADDENRRLYEQEQRAAAAERAPKVKKPKVDESPADIKRRLAEFRAKKEAALAGGDTSNAPANGVSSDGTKDEQVKPPEVQQPPEIIASSVTLSAAPSVPVTAAQYYQLTPAQGAFPPPIPGSMPPGFPAYPGYPLPGMPPVPNFPQPQMPYGVPPPAGYPPTAFQPPPGYPPYSMPPSMSPLAQAPAAHGLPPRPSHIPHHYPHHPVMPKEQIADSMRGLPAQPHDRQPPPQPYTDPPDMRPSLPPDFPFKYFRDSHKIKAPDAAEKPTLNAPHTDSPSQNTLDAQHDGSQPMTVQELIAREEKKANDRISEERAQKEKLASVNAMPVTATETAAAPQAIEKPTIVHASPAGVTTASVAAPDSAAAAAISSSKHTSDKKGKSKRTDTAARKLKLGDNTISWEEKRAAKLGPFSSRSLSATTTGPGTDAVSGVVDEVLS